MSTSAASGRRDRPRQPHREQAQRAAEVRRLHHAESVDWHNSSLLGGDVAAEVAKLKELPGDELQVHGSGELAQTLIEHDLIDEYRLYYFPVHLGSGKKLFRDGTRGAALRLISTSTTETGVVIASYASAGPLRHDSHRPGES